MDQMDEPGDTVHGGVFAREDPADTVHGGGVMKWLIDHSTTQNFDVPLCFGLDLPAGYTTRLTPSHTVATTVGHTLLVSRDPTREKMQMWCGAVPTGSGPLCDVRDKPCSDGFVSLHLFFVWRVERECVRLSACQTSLIFLLTTLRTPLSSRTRPPSFWPLRRQWRAAAWTSSLADTCAPGRPCSYPEPHFEGQ